MSEVRGKFGSSASCIVAAAAAILLFAFANGAYGQTSCVNAAEAAKIIASLEHPATPDNAAQIRKELVDMQIESERFHDKIEQNVEKNRNLLPQEAEMNQKRLARVCEILKTNGWLSKDAIKEDGLAALTYIITTNKSFGMQRELLPVLIAAGKKGFVSNPFIATIVDNLRVGAGQPQIFGTQATIRNGVVYIYPLLNEGRVDEWRALYNLDPLATVIRTLERRYQMPVLKSQRLAGQTVPAAKNDAKNSDTAILGISESDESVIKVDSRIVSLNVRILTKDEKPTSGLNLTKDDFTILDGGVEQTPEFFSATDQPFDLVLVLDYSGSTMSQRDLVKKAAQRFIESARPTDRIAVVVFTHEIRTVCDLTTDKAELIKKVKGFDAEGGSAIWDAVLYTYNSIIKKESVGRRSAIVLMSDGADGSRKAVFTDLMETVRRSDTTFYSVCLVPVFMGVVSRNQLGRQSMFLLSQESGGQFYSVAELKDLKGVYDQVINDLGKVYSIGYEPKSDVHDGGWRPVTVQVKSRPDLITKTRSGYYAN